MDWCSSIISVCSALSTASHGRPSTTRVSHQLSIKHGNLEHFDSLHAFEYFTHDVRSRWKALAALLSFLLQVTSLLVSQQICILLFAVRAFFITFFPKESRRLRSNANFFSAQVTWICSKKTGSSITQLCWSETTWVWCCWGRERPSTLWTSTTSQTKRLRWGPVQSYYVWNKENVCRAVYILTAFPTISLFLLLGEMLQQESWSFVEFLWHFTAVIRPEDQIFSELLKAGLAWLLEAVCSFFFCRLWPLRSRRVYGGVEENNGRIDLKTFPSTRVTVINKKLQITCCCRHKI